MVCHGFQELCGHNADTLRTHADTRVSALCPRCIRSVSACIRVPQNPPRRCGHTCIRLYPRPSEPTPDTRVSACIRFVSALCPHALCFQKSSFRLQPGTCKIFFSASKCNNRLVSILAVNRLVFCLAVTRLVWVLAVARLDHCGFLMLLGLFIKFASLMMCDILALSLHVTNMPRHRRQVREQIPAAMSNPISIKQAPRLLLSISFFFRAAYPFFPSSCRLLVAGAVTTFSWH